jgi:adenylylsulfate kinase-like enzyme
MSDTSVHVLVLSGPAGVGKSTLSWEISIQLREAAVPHAALDSDELDRVWPLSNTEQDALNRANLAAFWSNVSALGHRRLVLAGVFLNFAADRAWISAAIPGARLTRVVLDASDEELERRIRTREIGSPSPARRGRAPSRSFVLSGGYNTREGRTIFNPPSRSRTYRTR